MGLLRSLAVQGIASEPYLKLEVPADARVKFVKEELRRATFRPVEQQVLLWRETVLEDHRQIMSYDMEEDSRLTLIICSSLEVASGRYPLVGKVLAAVRDGVFLPRSSGFDVAWDASAVPPVSDDKFGDLVSDACGGVCKPVATRARFLKYLDVWLSSFKTWAVTSVHAIRTVLPPGLRTIKHELYKQVVRGAAMCASRITSPKLAVVPKLNGDRHVRGCYVLCSDVLSTGGLLFPPDVQEELCCQDMVRDASLYRDSTKMFEDVLCRIKPLKLQHPPNFLLQDGEVLPLIHAHMQLFAGICPILVDDQLTNNAAELLAYSNGLKPVLREAGCLDMQRIQTEHLAEFLEDDDVGESESGMLIFLFVTDIPKEWGEEHLQAAFHAVQECSRQPVNFVVCKRPSAAHAKCTTGACRA